MTIAATSINPTGTFTVSAGSPEAFTSLSDDSAKHLIKYGSDAFSLMKSVEFSVKRPKVAPASPSGFTQARNTMLVRYPITTASGIVTVNTLNLTTAFDVETTDAQKLEGMKCVAYCLIASSVFDFWYDQSLA